MEMLVLTFLAVLQCIIVNAFVEASLRNYDKRQTTFRKTTGYITVAVAEGLLKGRISKSVTGEFMVSFQGVPYARPPIKQLRFMDPVPLEPWTDTRGALEEENVCPQIENGVLMGSEDCLYLNVYLRQLPSGRESELMPVMVWIHGGYFQHGSGNGDLYGPDYLIDEGVVVVTINYRLGPLGFLFLPDAVPGNAGMKDQVLALRWVQRNIKVLGGNPNLVTIFGQSAGAAAVHLHMLSPACKGLFHRAIAQSGSAIHKVFVESSPVETSSRLAEAVKCSGRNASANLRCLQFVDVQELLVAGVTKARSDEERKRFMSFPFVPVADSKMFPNQFLPDAAINLVKQGKHHNVPYLTGYTDAESLLLFSLGNLFNGDIQKTLDKSWADKILRGILSVEKTKEEDAEKALRNYYLGGGSLTNDTLKGYLTMLTDTYGECITQTLKYMEKSRSKTPLYLYYFTADDVLNDRKRDMGVHLPGASHGDDLGYLFHMDKLPMVPENSTAAITRKNMVRLWTNFAKYGDPGNFDGTSKWLPYDTKTRHYLQLGNPPLKLKTSISAERAKFWEQFRKRYGDNSAD